MSRKKGFHDLWEAVTFAEAGEAGRALSSQLPEGLTLLEARAVDQDLAQLPNLGMDAERHHLPPCPAPAA